MTDVNDDMKIVSNRLRAWARALN